MSSLYVSIYGVMCDWDTVKWVFAVLVDGAVEAEVLFVSGEIEGCGLIFR